jgi:hypothetical protein
MYIPMLLQNSVLLESTVGIGSTHEGKKGNAYKGLAVKTSKEEAISEM